MDVVYPHILLRRDNWNDYGFETLFSASVHLSAEHDWQLGGVKLAHYGHTSDKNMRDVLLPAQDELGEEYFSLGQGLEYYEQLLEMPSALRSAYAEAMRDIPLLGLQRARLEQEPSFEISLLRTSGAREALDRAPALFGAEGNDVRAFDFTTKLPGAAAPHSIRLNFEEDSGLPHRINVLVGVNGVGKTQLMARLATLLTSFEATPERNRRMHAGGTLKDLGSLSPLPSFYGVIAVSFSAFDDFELPDTAESSDFRYVYCGLRRRDGTIAGDDALPSRVRQLLAAMDEDRRVLALDALSRALGISVNPEELADDDFHRDLSAGQRIVANIVTDLCLHLRSRSLVLLDEPETHLHPQLVTRLLSVVNDLLEGFDAVAVIATHTPPSAWRAKSPNARSSSGCSS